MVDGDNKEFEKEKCEGGEYIFSAFKCDGESIITGNIIFDMDADIIDLFWINTGGTKKGSTLLL